MKTTHLIGRMHRTRITSLSGGPFQNPQDVLTTGQLDLVAAKTGKTRGSVTWDDVYRIAGLISQLWMQIAPLIFARKGSVPTPPDNLPPPKASSINWGMVLLAFGGAIAVGIILKAGTSNRTKRKGPRYDDRKR